MKQAPKGAIFASGRFYQIRLNRSNEKSPEGLRLALFVLLGFCGDPS
jgi:hypothetical protein